MRTTIPAAIAALALTASAQQAHQPEAKPMHTNRLTGETSPYLLQHAHNPVDWFPWGDEAFEEARRRDVPIFLSIGYSTCYWCHVMERESFESEATARVMNEHYVCVKVDREERPDVDDIYMAATQALTGRGGWPMSVWLEPESLRPFYAGTYFPPEQRHGMPAFTDVLLGISEAWKGDRRQEIIEQSQSLADAVRHQLEEREAPVVVGENEIMDAVSGLLRIYDSQWGGFGGAPKFPQPTYIEFLLAVRDSADESTRQAIDQSVRGTLDKMMIGGIRDHVGGGFHRYSVDAEWTVPHFEKMLYDQGQLLSVYAKAAAVYEDSEYERTAIEIADYVLREMTDESGAFYSAQDAEVDGKEGLNYLWLESELRDVLTEDESKLALDVYSVASGPNFQDPHHPDEPARNVLRFSERPEQTAARLGLSVDELHAKLDAVNAKLKSARDERKQPGLDDKILTSWNAIAIHGLASLGNVSGNQAYTDAAVRATDVILTTMRDGEGTLLRTARAGEAKTPAFFEDYAWLTAALIELHHASDDTKWLDKASSLAEEAESIFGDPDSGGFFDTRENQSDLFVRGQIIYDGAIPSATSVFLNALIDLSTLTGEQWFASRAARGLVATSGAIHRAPVGYVNSARGLYRALSSDIPLAQALQAAGAKQPAQSHENAESFQAVEVFADTERISLKPGEVETFRVKLQIADGYHIVAADPGPDAADMLEPLRVGVVGGTGVGAFADYPAGVSYRTEGVEGELLVYSSEVEFDIVLEAENERAGRPIVIVTFQACSDTECLQPQTVELDVAIDVTN
ncbi:MAG: DUF255 domain-containing protein [Phycisphaera sp.]|nr:MAG: DUF255 domain-containing protein [Phycisphaera sp.]